MSLSKPQDQLAYELSCPICLQLYSDPVVLPCGHNYCRTCICKNVGTIDKKAKTLPRCPECREEYRSVDSLQKNFKLCSIVEGYQAAARQLDWQTVAENMKVFCDYCIDEQSPAVKTCLKCEVLLCSRHFEKHNEKETFKAHAMVEPLNKPRMKCCVIHRSPYQYFCTNDMTSLCTTCFKEGHHQNHDVLTFTVAEEEMRRVLQSRSKVISCKLQKTESLLQKTAEEQAAYEALGDKLINKAVTLVESMAGLVDRYRDRMQTLLDGERDQSRKSWQLGLSALEEQQQRLLLAQRTATEALSETDTSTFIQRFILIEKKLREVVTDTIPPSVPSKALLNTKHLQADLKTQDFRSEMTQLLDSLTILLSHLHLTFNLCTAHPNLIVSNDLRTVKYSPTKQPYTDHPERFTCAPQVLCSQGLSSGQHMWVVEVGVNSMWSLGVCYKSIPRRGGHSRLGHNSVSWRLQWKNGKLLACQSSCNVVLGEMTNHPLRIEVTLNYEAGILTFQSTKGHREHLHTFRVMFREPVYPAFSIHSNTPESWITLYSGM